MNTLCTANQQLTLATTIFLSRGQLTEETAGVSRWKMLGKVITMEGEESESFISLSFTPIAGRRAGWRKLSTL